MGNEILEKVERDFFGNVLDIEVGYARGSILSDSFAEKTKQQHAVTKINERIEKYGEDSLSIFTGNIRMNQLEKEDLGIRSEEWVGPSLFYPSLRKKVLEHFGLESEELDVSIFNRTSAAIVSSILALVKPGESLISYAPNKKAHPSVSRGAKLAKANLLEIESADELNSLNLPEGTVCLITGVTSELLYLENDQFVNAIKVAKRRGFTVIVDDAYGARIRTILLGQPPALQAGADLVITNNDKAALHGPRAGVMAGEKDLVVKVSAKASELGLEARAPISLAVLRSIEKFNKEELIAEQRVGQSLYEGLSKKLGTEKVRQTLLGPEISEENAMKYVLEKRQLSVEDCKVVPAEVTTAIGFILLEKYGIVTTNTCGMPGARVSLRLKTNEETVMHFGGINQVIEAVLDSIDTVADIVDNLDEMRNLILGR